MKAKAALIAWCYLVWTSEDHAYLSVRMSMFVLGEIW